MSDLVTRLRMQATAFRNAAFYAGREPDQEEAGIITDLREAASRICHLEMALVELASDSHHDHDYQVISRCALEAKP